jgi:hypothetical protein
MPTCSLSRTQPADHREVAEVTAVPLLAHVVGLALDDVGAEVGRRVKGQVIGEKCHVADEDAANHRILAGSAGLAAVVRDPVHHLLKLTAPLAGPSRSQASEAGSRAAPPKNPPPTTRLCGACVLKKNGSPGRKAWNPPQLAGLLGHVGVEIDRYRAGEIDAYAADETIHHYHRAAAE